MSSDNVLIVDDDPRICNLLSRYLRQEGFTTITAHSGSEMWGKIEAEDPNLVILDIKLPDNDGLTLARELRNRSSIGIIMLTGKSDPVDKVVGLELGADDYITKPFDQRELLARVRSVLRRTNSEQQANGTPQEKSNQDPNCASFDGWVLNFTEHTLTGPDGENVHLTSYEFQLLEALVVRANRTLSRDAILDLIAGREHHPQDRSIDVLIGKLRRKIEKDPKNPSMVKSIRGVGYKFTAKVEIA